MAPLRFLFFFMAFLVIQATADKCSAGCTGGANPKDGFQAGNTYSYWLEGVSQVRLSGADQQETAVRISAMATVVALGNCANLLKVTSLQITSPDGLKYNKVNDIEKPIRFTMQDGVVGSDICSEEGDNKFSLNIKRAILSMLQTATKHNTEVDVFGVCPTTFGVQNDGANGKAIHKNKNLNTCAYREQGKNDLLAYIYNPNAKLKDTNIMNAQMKVDTIVRNGVVEKAEAHEEYLYRPFSVGNNGATASVNTKLTLKETNKGTLDAKCVVPKSIIFENPHPVSTPHSNLNNAAQALNRAVKVLDKKVEAGSATAFGNLVKVMRVTSRDDLLNLYGQIQADAVGKNNKELAKKIFLDALFRTGTGESVEVVVQLFKNKELTPMQKKLALISMTTVRHATPAAVKAVSAFLNEKDLPNEAYIGAGALAGTFCKEYGCHGKSVPEIKDLSAKFLARLGNGKPTTKSEENTVIAVLKGIRNIHHLEDSVGDKLGPMSSDKNVKPRVRVAILEAFAADACMTKMQNNALKILKDANEDSEIRIKAYLALLECPNAKVAGELKTILDLEQVNQVGAFITSSLRNIRNSANPSRQAARQYFGSISTTRNFPIDGRKYSQNYEVSYDFETLGAGAIADSNVIYSQNSFLPRSASLNLTAEVFGRTINFLEIGARQGNLDRVMEEFFGPHGAINTHTPQQIYDYLKKVAVSVGDKINERSRPKRDIKQQTETFGKKLKTDIPGYNGELDLDIFVRLFGNDAIFLSLGDDKPFSLPEFIDRIFNIVDDGVNKAQQFSHELRSHNLLMDAELAYPTSNGLTMKIDIDAFATTKIEFGGNINLKNLLKDARNAKLDIKLVPSASIEASGTISFDADVVSTGLKVITALHTSTGTHVVAKLEEKGFDIQLGLPVEKQEIITSTNDIYFYTREKGKEDIDKEVKFNTDSWRKFSDCFDQLSNAVGLSVCADIFVPWMQENGKAPTVLPFPLGGPTKVGLRLEKDNINGFHIHGSMTEKGEGQCTMDLVVEAEGSKKPRKISFQLEKINRDDLKSLKAKLMSPMKDLQAHAILANSNKERSLTLGLKNDDEDYYGKIGLNIANADAQTAIYKPILEYKIPRLDGQHTKLDGTIKRTNAPGGKKYNFQGLSLVYQGNKVAIDGFVSTGDHSQVDLKVSSGDKKATIKGKYDVTKTSRTAELEFKNTVDNSFDFLFNGDVSRTDTFRKLDFALVHGPDSKSTQNKIKFSTSLKGNLQELNTNTDIEKLDFQYKNQFSYPLLDIKFDTEMTVAPKVFDLEFDASYGEQKLEFELESKCDKKTEGDFYGKFEFKANGKGIETEFDYAMTDKNKASFTSSAKVMNSPVYELKGTVANKVAENDVDVALHATLQAKGQGNDKKYKLDVFCIDNPAKHSSGIKVSQGANEMFDYQLNMVTGDNMSGDLKFLVKDLLNGQGQFKMDKNMNGNGDIMVNFLKANRKVKLDTKFTHENSHCTGNADLYLDFEKDNNNKINFNTNTKYSNTDKPFVDSVNALSFDGNKIDTTFKNEENANLKRNGMSFTLTLAKGMIVAVKNDFEQTTNKDDTKNVAYNRIVQYTARKGAKPYSLSLKGNGKNINRQEKTGDLEEHYTFTKENGDNADLKYNLYVKQADRTTIGLKGALGGNLIPSPVNIEGSYEMPNDIDESELTYFNYNFKGAYGDKAKVDGKGKYIITDYEDKDDYISNEMDVHMTLPFEKSTDVKISSKDVLTIPQADDKWFSASSTKTANVDGKTYHYDTEFELVDIGGKAKLTVQVPDHEKFTFDSAINCNIDEEAKKSTMDGHFNVDYGKGRELKVKSDGVWLHGNQVTLNSDVTLPNDYKFKHMVSTYVLKRSSPHSVSSEFKTNIDGKKYLYSSSLNHVPGDTRFDFVREAPEKKPAKFVMTAKKLSENNYKGGCKIENFRDFNMDLDVDALLFNADQWNVNVNLDCPKVNINKMAFKASNEALKTGNKKIEFSATENNNNVLSGVTTYQSKQEGDKFIMEGTGTVKIKNEDKPTSFKYIRQRSKDSGSHDVEVFYTVEIGGKSVLIEYKNTDLEYKLYSLYCEENKQCAHIDINRKLDTSVADKISHNVKLGFDLRKLGFAPEFGLKSSTELEKFKLPVHVTDIHLSQDASKYHVQMLAKPNKGEYQTSFTVTTPNRAIALESSTTYPDKISKDMKPVFKHETVFYPNKANLSLKTLFKIHSEVNKVDDNTYKSNQEVAFSSPGIGKELKVSNKGQVNIHTAEFSGDVVIDIFRKENQKVSINVAHIPQYKDNTLNCQSRVIVDGKGLGFNVVVNELLVVTPGSLKYEGKVLGTFEKQKREINALIDLTKDHQKLHFENSFSPLLVFENTFKSDDNHLLASNGKVELLGDFKATFDGSIRSKSPYGADYSLVTKNGKGMKLDAVLDVSKEAKLAALLIDGAQKKNLVDVGLYVEDKVLVPKMNVNTDNLKQTQKYVVDALKGLGDKASNVQNQMKDAMGKNIQKLGQNLKGALPDINAAMKPYTDELKAFEKELESDKAAQDIAKFMKAVVMPPLKVATDMIDQVVMIAKKALDFGAEVFEKISTLLNKHIIPEVKAFCDKLHSLFNELLDLSIDFVSHYVAFIEQMIEKHAKPFEPFFKDLYEYYKGMNKWLVEEMKDFRAQLVDFCENLKEQIQNLPIYGMITETLQEYNLSEVVLQFVQEVLETSKSIIPHDGYQDFVDALLNYITKKVKGEKVNDTEEMKKLYEKLMDITHSVTSAAESQIKPPTDLTDVYIAAPSNWLNVLSQLTHPSVPKFSIWNAIENDDYPSIDDIVRTYWPQSLNPMDMIPPMKLRGQVIGGQHLFTFDGRHITFPGNCRYVLSQDAVDGNFSVVLQLDKGYAKSITLVDKSGNAMEVNNKAEMKLNGAAYGFPVWKSDSVAWKTQHNIGMMSKYGVFIRCTHDLEICMITLSGYYSGKVRGLLGDGNNEQYDDLRLPNGKIAATETDFANAYALTTCPPVPTVEHAHGKNAHCSSFFSEDSLALCEKTVSKRNYQMACKHASMEPKYAANEKAAACLMARAYSMACMEYGFYVSYPDSCDTCNVDGKEYNYGDEFDVKLPQKQADILLAVETTTENKQTFKEIAVPLISNIIDELKGKKITDVKLNLIGITPKIMYPIYHDIESNKLKGTEIDFKDQQRSAPMEFPITTENEKLDKFLNNATEFFHKALVASGLSNIQLTYNMLSHYDMRPKAVKTLIMVHSEACADSIPVFVSNMYNSIMMEDDGASVHLIAPIRDLKSGAEQSKLFGFSENHAFVLGDKKRGLSNDNLRSDITHEDDGCVDFAENANGNVYSSDAFFKLQNANQKKNYLQLASHTIVDKMVNTQMHLSCKCTSSVWNKTSRVRCSVASKKAIQKKADKKK